MKIEEEFRSIEELYCWLYVEKIDTLKGQKEHEKLLRKYIDRGFTQYDAMVNLIISDERVQKKENGNYVFLKEPEINKDITLSVV